MASNQPKNIRCLFKNASKKIKLDTCTVDFSINTISTSSSDVILVHTPKETGISLDTVGRSNESARIPDTSAYGVDVHENNLPDEAKKANLTDEESEVKVIIAVWPMRWANDLMRNKHNIRTIYYYLFYDRFYEVKELNFITSTLYTSINITILNIMIYEKRYVQYSLSDVTYNQSFKLMIK